MLHDHFNRSLWAQIEKEQGFAEELKEYRRLKDELHDRCATWEGWSEDQHRKAILSLPSSPPSLTTPSSSSSSSSLSTSLSTPLSSENERLCHLAQLDSAGFVRLLKEEAGIPDPECHTQGNPRRRVVFIKTH